MPLISDPPPIEKNPPPNIKKNLVLPPQPTE